MTAGEGPAAGESVVELRYSLRPGEILTVIAAHDRHMWLSSGVAALMAFGCTWAVVGGDLLQATVCALFLAGGPTGLYGGLYGAFARRHWADGVVHKQFDGDTIRTTTDRTTAAEAWSTVSQVWVLRSALLFYQDVGQIFAVPRRAMTPRQEAAVLAMAGPGRIVHRGSWARPIAGALVGVLAFGAFYVAMVQMGNVSS